MRIEGAVLLGDTAGKFVGPLQTVGGIISVPVQIQGTVVVDSRTGRTVAALGDAIANPTVEEIGSFQMLFNGTSWERARTPNTSKSALITAAGATALWTPAAGKKFRLMAYSYQLGGDTIKAAAGGDLIKLQDGGTDIGGTWWRPYIPVAAVNQFGGPIFGPFVLRGNGYLSTTINNVLNVNLVTALTGGGLNVNVWGTEE